MYTLNKIVDVMMDFVKQKVGMMVCVLDCMKHHLKITEKPKHFVMKLKDVCAGFLMMYQLHVIKPFVKLKENLEYALGCTTLLLLPIRIIGESKF